MKLAIQKMNRGASALARYYKNLDSIHLITLRNALTADLRKVLHQQNNMELISRLSLAAIGEHLLNKKPCLVCNGKGRVRKKRCENCEGSCRARFTKEELAKICKVPVNSWDLLYASSYLEAKRLLAGYKYLAEMQIRV